MKYFLCLLCFFLPEFSAFAQKAANHYIQDRVNLPSNNFKIDTNAYGDTISIADFVNLNTNQLDRKNISKKYLGTPLFFNGWHKGTLFFKNSAPVSGTLAYNLLNDKVYFSQGPVQPALEIKPNAFEINGHLFERFDDQFKKAGKYYYQRLVINEKTYYKRSVKYLITDFKHPEIIDTSEAESYQGSFISQNKYYLVNNERFRQIDPGLKAFGPFTKKVMDIIRENKLDLRKESDLLTLLKYL
ncbi:hypothetical protein [Jiulongibacter sediminis]|uniref:Uncharacterized protein n=1 Tax=Jiulongibacter sediminis TaxID=1605367 RepID=A0A0P7BZ51_9BACT|nr:hypothetical protein [Jiulongibacter sediminis]KPM47455.1 hypothetical protein AFM12_13160 [Jiulongibacter sediminis]TBX23250.1 hypothetical protein TK44_13170 [Jiulongibacter sediminis]